MIWNLCDNDWTGEPETSISITGLIAYLLDVPICWCSKAQRSVTLSSTEAKYVTISEAAKQIKFVYYLLKDIHVEVILPIVVKTDDVGIIFMSENASTGIRTRHVDTRYDFVRELIEDAFIKIKFVYSDENDSYFMGKEMFIQ